MTYEELVRSRQLRSLVLDYNLSLLASDPKPVCSFERQYSNKRDEETAGEQSFRQTSVYKELNRQISEVAPHNQEMVREYRQEEAGLEGEKDDFDMDALKQQVKA